LKDKYFRSPCPIKWSNPSNLHTASQLSTKAATVYHQRLNSPSSRWEGRGSAGAGDWAGLRRLHSQLYNAFALRLLCLATQLPCCAACMIRPPWPLAPLAAPAAALGLPLPWPLPPPAPTPAPTPPWSESLPPRGALMAACAKRFASARATLRRMKWPSTSLRVLRFGSFSPSSLPFPLPLFSHIPLSLPAFPVRVCFLSLSSPRPRPHSKWTHRTIPLPRINTLRVVFSFRPFDPAMTPATAAS
jgi:hypothetical protein